MECCKEFENFESFLFQWGDEMQAITYGMSVSYLELKLRVGYEQIWDQSFRIKIISKLYPTDDVFVIFSHSKIPISNFFLNRHSNFK